MSKQSPAPWTYRQDGGALYDANGEMVAVVNRDEDRPVIAAAPEMLALLKRMNHPSVASDLDNFIEEIDQLVSRIESNG